MKGEKMKFFENGNTQVIALGGLGEVGKNMYVFVHNDEIIIIDSGVMFPKDELLGIDYVIPDYTFLKENESKIKGLFITHGHEDHIGGIPFLLQQVNIPAIYAPNQAAELIKRKIEERYYINELPIIATLSKAIQEQQEQINKLQSKIPSNIHNRIIGAKAMGKISLLAVI